MGVENRVTEFMDSYRAILKKIVMPSVHNLKLGSQTQSKWMDNVFQMSNLITCDHLIWWECSCDMSVTPT